jgi:transcriptional regulator with XRE-family HTH domain
MGRRPYVEHPFRRVKLIEQREQRGIARDELAEKLGLTRGYVFRVEEGLRNPSHDTMVRWARALNTSMDFFDAQPSAAAK